MEPRRLYRSQTNKIIAGVCGGYAEYFDVDPVIMRLLFVLLAFFGGSGFLIYIASMILIPKRPLDLSGAEGAAGPAPAADARVNIRFILGAVLIAFGVLFLLSNLGLFAFMHAWDMSWEFVFPILLILLGMAIIYYRQNEPVPEPTIIDTTAAGGAEVPPASEPAQPFSRAPRQLRRSIRDRKIFGVCGGLAEYFSIDANLTRILYVILCLATGGAGILLYFILALLVPDERYVKTQP
ncbi:MAG: PspC domain-containing protein [Acidobacteriota bacterium]